MSKITLVNSKIELEKREGEVIRENLNNAINMRVAGRTQKKYYKDSRDQLQTKQEIYNENNKENLGKVK